METIEKEGFKLVGIMLPGNTTNEGGKSAVDCGNLWRSFYEGGYYRAIPSKEEEAVYAVYFNYEGDHTKPFSYFIGCRVPANHSAPAGMMGIHMPSGRYAKLQAKGKMPGCIAQTWRQIWDSDLKRAYLFDFEVYDGRSNDTENAEVDVFISVTE